VRTLADGGFSHVAGGRNYMAGLAAHSKTMKFLSSSGVSKEKQLASTTYPAGRYVAECRTHCRC
jgi:hypothetical protein